LVHPGQPAALFSKPDAAPEVAMPENESYLERMPTRELVEKYHDLEKQATRSAHDRARQKLVESLELGQPREETDAIFLDRGRVETDTSRIEEMREVKAEINRRVQAGDPDAYAIAAEEYGSLHKELPQDFLNDLMRRVGPPPREIVQVQPERNKASPSSASKQRAQKTRLTEREKKIWEVIKRGTKGRTYCRELDHATIAPPRAGVWKDGPRKYLATYDLGSPWRHRIEDEKAKIRRKAAKLAGALASE
jgi:hypothetical protein